MPAPERQGAGCGRRSALGWASAFVLTTLVPAATGQALPRTIRIVARRFQFEPDTIELRQGESVSLEFEAPDVIMGFNLHDFGLRADLLPGQVTRVPLTATKAGEFPFFCDVFCGSGHEQMDGLLRVVA